MALSVSPGLTVTQTDSVVALEAFGTAVLGLGLLEVIWGVETLSTCPSRRRSSLSLLVVFNFSMLVLKRSAMAPSVSPDCTVYVPSDDKVDLEVVWLELEGFVLALVSDAPLLKGSFKV
jgi:hypothetical protein